MYTFLHQTDKFIITGDMAAQTFWQWSDDIKPEDDITPFDGTVPYQCERLIRIRISVMGIRNNAGIRRADVGESRRPSLHYEAPAPHYNDWF